MAYGDVKYFTSRTVSDKILRDKAFNITENFKYVKCQRGLGLMIYNVFYKKTSGSDIKNKIILIKNQQKNYTKQLLKNPIKEK